MGRTTLVLLLLGGAVVVLLLTTPEPSPESEVNDPNQNMEHELEDINFRRTLEGDRLWTLKAPTARRVEDGFHLTRPRITLSEGSREVMNARAEEAWYNEQEEVLRTEGEVEIRRPTDDQLFCTRVLNWNLLEDTVHTEGSVLMLEPNRRLTSDGMAGNLSLERVQFLSNVRLVSGSFALQCSWPLP